MCDAIKPEHLGLVENVLELHSSKRYLVVEVYLKCVLSLPKGIRLTDRIERQIFELTRSESSHIRYLAVRCLPRCETLNYLERILMISREDSVRRIRQAALKSLLEVLENNQEALVGVLALSAKDHRLTGILYKLFKILDCSESGFDRLLFILLALIDDHRDQSQMTHKMQGARLMVLMRVQIKKHRAFLLRQLLQNQDWDDAYLRIIMRILRSLNPEDAAEIPSDIFIKQYPRLSWDTQMEYLRFFQMYPQRNETLERLIFQDLSCPKNKTHEMQLQKVVTSWFSSQTHCVGAI